MKRLIVIIALVASGVANAANDCNSGLTPDNSTAITLTSATVNWVGVRGTKIVASLTSGTCSQDVYIEETDKSRLSILLTAKSTNRTVKAYFQYDSGSPDYIWGGMVATRYLTGIDLE